MWCEVLSVLERMHMLLKKFASDLLVAVEGVLHRKQFVSAGLTDQIITNPQQGKATGLI
jgi:hypothetical protein